MDSLAQVVHTEAVDWIFLISMPFITALIGWLTNKVAIWMLFRPRHARTILGWKWQGVIPRRQDEVAETAADLIEKEILEKHVIRREIQRIDVHPLLHEFANRIVYESLAPRIRKLPLFGNALATATLSSIHKAVLDMIQKEAPELLVRLSVEAEKRLDLRRMVHDRIASFDLDKLEGVVTAIAAKEFRSIEIMGAVLGFIVGLVQLLILLLAGMLS